MKTKVSGDAVPLWHVDVPLAEGEKCSFALAAASIEGQCLTVRVADEGSDVESVNGQVTESLQFRCVDLATANDIRVRAGNREVALISVNFVDGWFDPRDINDAGGLQIVALQRLTADRADGVVFAAYADDQSARVELESGVGFEVRYSAKHQTFQLIPMLQLEQGRLLSLVVLGGLIPVSSCEAELGVGEAGFFLAVDELEETVELETVREVEELLGILTDESTFLVAVRLENGFNPAAVLLGGNLSILGTSSPYLVFLGHDEEDGRLIDSKGNTFGIELFEGEIHTWPIAS